MKKDENFLKYYGKIEETKKKTEKTTKTIDKRIVCCIMETVMKQKTTIPIKIF